MSEFKRNRRPAASVTEYVRRTCHRLPGTRQLDKGPASKLLPEDASAVDRVKYSLCEKFVIYMNKHRLTQRALAEQIAIDEALMSKILHFNIEDFTTDRLLKYLAVIYPNVELDVKLNVA